MAAVLANITNQIKIHQEDDHNNDDDNTGDTTGQANVMTGEASAAGSSTGFNLRVEQNKIQEYFGSKSKDTISAMDFVRQLEDLAKTKKVVRCPDILQLSKCTPESTSEMVVIYGGHGQQGTTPTFMVRFQGSLQAGICHSNQ
jgi:hypothetical protein